MNTPRMIISTKLKVAELKQICAGMGICDGGTKKELLKRINESINNYDSLTQSNSTNSQNMMETVPHVDPISLAENNEITYEAYVSEQNLLIDDSDEPIKHPLINEIFSGKKGSTYFKPSN